MSAGTGPPILILKEGTDTSQGKGQLLSNITACQAIVDVVKTTLGPRGMDKLIHHDESGGGGGGGGVTISNDGATILRLLDVVHPAARTLADIARSQDAEVGDGTTSVVLLAGELLRLSRDFVEDGVHPQVIIRAFRRAERLAARRAHELAVDASRVAAAAASSTPAASATAAGGDASGGAEGHAAAASAGAAPAPSVGSEPYRVLLQRCASTALNSKLLAHNKHFFARMVVDAVLTLDDDLDLSMVGVKKVGGGAATDSSLIPGVGFKKTFSYAGFEQQPKKLAQPRVVLLNMELEIKSEKENAEVRIDSTAEYQRVVDAEWSIIYDKLDKVVATGAKVVLSRLAIGDLATQYFADRGIFCAGRVPEDDLQRVAKAVGATVQTTVNDVQDDAVGSCDSFEERQVGSERFNFFTGCPRSHSATILLRGGSEQFLDEAERSLHDAVMIVRRTIKFPTLVAGGGAIEMELSKYLREHAHTIVGKSQLLEAAFAKALEVIPRTLCENAGHDANDALNRLRAKHASDASAKWHGLDVDTGEVRDCWESYVWEPALVRLNALAAATEAACMVLSVDESITAASNEDESGGGGGGGGMFGRGGGRQRRGR